MIALCHGLLGGFDRALKAFGEELQAPVFGWTQDKLLEGWLRNAYRRGSEVSVVGHSFGVTGWCRAICAVNKPAGVTLRMFSCDGVQFPSPKHELVFPNEIDQLWVWWQRVNKRLHGSAYAWNTVTTTRMLDQQLSVTHARCTREADFQDAVRREAQ